jgi:hypothetical protein
VTGTSKSPIHGSGLIEAYGPLIEVIMKLYKAKENDVRDSVPQ